MINVAAPQCSSSDGTNQDSSTLGATRKGKAGVPVTLDYKCTNSHSRNKAKLLEGRRSERLDKNLANA